MRRALPFLLMPAVLAVALVLASDHEAHAGPYNYDPTPAGVQGPDGVVRTMAGDNYGHPAVIPSTGASANTYQLSNLLVVDTDGGAPCPTTQLSGRMDVEICNSVANSGTPLLVITLDGTAPVVNPLHGKALVPGGCWPIPLGSTTVPRCISNVASPGIAAEITERK